MSQEKNQEHAEQTETLEVLREECSPAISSVNMNMPKITDKDTTEIIECGTHCVCQQKIVEITTKPKEVEKLLRKKEEQLEANFKEKLEKEIELLKERANFILQNEQIRASVMLREAHRERQEKISALQTQLQCKNLAALMYVMCTERRRSKLEKMRIIEDYTKYIRALQDILTESQELILNLSRGYKTAARVDHEWRTKMTKVLTEFQIFVHDYAKGTPESDQFFFDIPKLLKTKTSVVDDPCEDPCEPDDGSLLPEEPEEEKSWYEKLEDECRPFVVYGDLGDFKPAQRRQVLGAVKRRKVAPSKWKEYMFNEMFVKAECSNTDIIKDEYPKRMLPPPRWDCYAQYELGNQSQMSFARRTTTASVDVRGNMGSILKMITSSNAPPQPRATLLGARDSMEIASATKVREKHKNIDHTKVVLNIGSRRTSLFDESRYLDEEEEASQTPAPSQPYKHKSITRYDAQEHEVEVKSASALRPSKTKSATRKDGPDRDKADTSASALGSLHNDSLTVMQSHVPEPDHKIRYEKICPMEKCQRLEVDSFMRALPAYMRASPFTHFEQTFEEYDTCTPEQLEILKERIDKKKAKEKAEMEVVEESPLDEWSGVDGVGVQTSDILYPAIPPCTCKPPRPSPIQSLRRIYDIEDLIPVKQALNKINKECFYDSNIEFHRFKVIGQESRDSIKEETKRREKNKLQEITKVLYQHPSLLDIFQGNTA